MKAYLIKWIDITHDSGWHTLQELEEYVANKKENVCTQVGFMYSQDKRITVMVDSWIGEGE